MLSVTGLTANDNGFTVNGTQMVNGGVFGTDGLSHCQKRKNNLFLGFPINCAFTINE